MLTVEALKPQQSTNIIFNCNIKINYNINFRFSVINFQSKLQSRRFNPFKNMGFFWNYDSL